MKNLATLLFSLLLFTSIAQERATLERLRHDKEVCKEFAEKSIQELDGGVLLVRLNFRQKQIDYLNKNQNPSEAKLIEKTAMKENEKIAEAFSKHFDFCEVYFFKMADSKHVLSQNFDSITFYDLSLKAVDNSKMATDNYLIGEFSCIKQDTVYYADQKSNDTSLDDPKAKTYFGGAKNGREAFIIMDRKFQQIRKPFPYFAGLEVFLSEGVRYKKALEKINSKLHAYSTQVGKKTEL